MASKTQQAKRSTTKRTGQKAQTQQQAPKRAKLPEGVAELTKLYNDNVDALRAYDKANNDKRTGKITEAEADKIKKANHEGHRLAWGAYEKLRGLGKSPAKRTPKKATPKTAPAKRSTAKRSQGKRGSVKRSPAPAPEVRPDGPETERGGLIGQQPE